MAKEKPVKQKTEIELLKEELKKIERVEIPFDLPVLERVKLECESFLKDVEVELRGAMVKFTYVPLGIGRAIYRMLKSKPELCTLWDQKKLTVQLVEKDVSDIVKEGKQLLYISGEEKGYGFETLNHIRVSDDVVDVQLVELSIKTIKENSSKTNTIYLQDEKAIAMRLKIRELEAEVKRLAEEKRKKEAEEKKQEAKPVVVSSKPKVELPKEPIAPDRTDVKYGGLFGDMDYEDDLNDYKIAHAEWEKKCLSLNAKQSVLEESEDDSENELCNGQLSIDDLEDVDYDSDEINEDEDSE